MATFKSHYTTSELLNLMKRCSLTHCYWSYNNGLYTFYFLDNRRCPKLESNGLYSFVSHKANYYRLRNKIDPFPFRIRLDSRSNDDKYNCYFYYLVPDSVFLNEGSSEKLNQLNEQSDGNLIVNVAVI